MANKSIRDYINLIENQMARDHLASIVIDWKKAPNELRDVVERADLSAKIPCPMFGDSDHPAFISVYYAEFEGKPYTMADFHEYGHIQTTEFYPGETPLNDVRSRALSFSVTKQNAVITAL